MRRQRRSNELWRIYDRAWPAHLGTADTHFEWLRARGLLEEAESLFSIGPGRGELELRLVREFGLELGYAEPVRHYRRALEREAATLLLDSKIVERQRGPYRAALLSRTYDLILSVHSWYGVGRDPDVLERTLASLSPGGTLLISVSSREDFFVREGLARALMVAEDLSDWVGRLGLEHRLYRVERELPVELLVMGGQPTQVGKDVLSFFAGRPWRSLDRSARRQRQEILLRSEHRSHFTRSHGVLVIPKSSATAPDPGE
jgi:SAM-dependent methyltransferase